MAQWRSGAVVAVVAVAGPAGSTGVDRFPRDAATGRHIRELPITIDKLIMA